MPVAVVIALIAALSLVVGVAGGCIGAYVGMKIGIVKLETWRQIMDGDVKSAQREIGLLREDCLVFDMEIGDIMRLVHIARIRRQGLR